jgi:hypothetical protein
MQTITFIPQNSAQQNAIMAFAEREKLEVMLDEFDAVEENDNFEMTPELMQLLDERLMEAENESIEWIPWEETKRISKRV